MRSGISLRFHQLLHILWGNISNPDARGEEKPSTLNYKNRSFPQTLLWQSLKDHCGARGGEIPRLFHSTPALQDTHLLPSLRQCYLPASLTHWGCSLATSFQRVCQLPGQAFEPARCTDTHTSPSTCLRNSQVSIYFICPYGYSKLLLLYSCYHSIQKPHHTGHFLQTCNKNLPNIPESSQSRLLDYARDKPEESG